MKNQRDFHGFTVWLPKAVFSPITAIVSLAFLAYGLLSPWLGFYWDDWPLMWLAYEFEPSSLQQLANYHVRPLSGWVLWAIRSLVGEQPIGWHLVILLFRLAATLLIYRLAKLLWPEKHLSPLYLALFFLLYPGYRHQFVSVNTTYHVFGLVLFLSSLVLTVKSLQGGPHQLAYAGCSLLLALGSMLTSEYFYGLELIRPAVAFLAVRDQEGIKRFKHTLKVWLPSAIVLLGLYAWRYSISSNLNYPVLIFRDLHSRGLVALYEYLAAALQDLVDVTLGAWATVFQSPDTSQLGIRSLILVLLPSIVSAVFIYILSLRILRKDNSGPNRAGEIIGLGITALVVAGIPFWVTKLDISAHFPSDRFILPMMMGGSLLAAGLLEWATTRYTKWLILVPTLLISLAIAFQLQTALDFYRDSKYLNEFLAQLQWRAPSIRENTTLISPELPISYSTDDSITAALNWVYGYTPVDGQMFLNLNYLKLRFRDANGLHERQSIVNNYIFFRFEGDGEDIAVIDFNPPGCLRIYHPIYDPLVPHINPEIKDAISFSNVNLISNFSTDHAQLPGIWFEAPAQESWCTYFEEADLARQVGDWEEVVRLGDKAFKLSDSPNRAEERLPFIEGYARLGDFSTAERLSGQALEINPDTLPALCSLWHRVLDASDGDGQRHAAITAVVTKLGCRGQQ